MAVIFYFLLPFLAALNHYQWLILEGFFPSVIKIQKEHYSICMPLCHVQEWHWWSIGQWLAAAGSVPINCNVFLQKKSRKEKYLVLSFLRFSWQCGWGYCSRMWHCITGLLCLSLPRNIHSQMSFHFVSCMLSCDTESFTWMCVQACIGETWYPFH